MVRSIKLGLLVSASLLLMLLSSSCFERFSRKGTAESEKAAGHEGHAHAEGHDEEEGHGHSHAEESHEEHAGHDEHAEGEEHSHDEHGEEHAHGEHAESEGRDEHGHAHAQLVELGPEVLKAYGVVVAKAKPGKLQNTLTLPGEVAIDTDRVSHVVTPVTGVVSAVHYNLGDVVKRGALMIELDSTELAEAKSRYLESLEHRRLAKSTYQREEKLWKQGISAEQEYLAAKNELAEADIAINTARQALTALRVPSAEIDNLAAGRSANLTKYRVYASAGGRVVEKHVSLGELLTPEQEAFTLADLSNVWIKLSVHQRDLERVRVGQAVAITSPDSKGDIQAKVEYIEPVIGEDTRMATARVRLSNPGGDWRPGLFVTGRVVVDSEDVAVLVPQDAVQTVEGKTVVFVQEEHGFEAREVVLGKQNETHVEIKSGLNLGEPYVVKNAFLVKAELGKAEAEHEH